MYHKSLNKGRGRLFKESFYLSIYAIHEDTDLLALWGLSLLSEPFRLFFLRELLLILLLVEEALDLLRLCLLRGVMAASSTTAGCCNWGI